MSWDGGSPPPGTQGDGDADWGVEYEELPDGALDGGAAVDLVRYVRLKPEDEEVRTSDTLFVSYRYTRIMNQHVEGTRGSSKETAAQFFGFFFFGAVSSVVLHFLRIASDLVDPSICQRSRSVLPGQLVRQMM